MSSPEALIVGGGIAGLACAITLGRQGWRCSLLERDPQRQRKGQGQGLLLPPSGHQALQRLAVGDIASFSAAIDRYELCRPDGRPDQEFAIHGALSLLHRDLLIALQRSLPASAGLVAGRCRALETAADGNWQVLCDDLPPLRADLIVAADGVGSVCRRQLFPKARLTQERTTELVLVTRDPVLVRTLGNACRKFQDRAAGLAIGLLPCRNDQLLVFAQFARDRHEPCAGPEAAALLRRCFGGWNALLDPLLDSLDTSDCRLWHTTDLDPLPRLHDGNLVLVGDSGHPLLTVTSQGASSALEDAQVLAEELASGLHGLSASLERYSRRRLPLLADLVREGRVKQQQFLAPAAGSIQASAPLVGFGLEPSLAT